MKWQVTHFTKEFERAIRMMPPGAEQIVWMGDFAGTDKTVRTLDTQNGSDKTVKARFIHKNMERHRK